MSRDLRALGKVSTAEQGWRMVPDAKGKAARTNWKKLGERDGRALHMVLERVDAGRGEERPGDQCCRDPDGPRQTRIRSRTRARDSRRDASVANVLWAKSRFR